MLASRYSLTSPSFSETLALCASSAINTNRKARLSAMQTILVHITPDKVCRHRLSVAIALAQEHRAHLVGLYTKSPSITPPVIVGRGASAAFTREMESAAAENEQDASAEFKAATARAAVSASWVHYDGEMMEGLATHSRFADLLVVSQTPPETLRRRHGR